MTKEIISDFSRAIKSKLSLEPSIYVICLAAQTNGIAYGQWINADKSLAVLKFEIESVLAKSPIANAKEWIIQKHEDFGDVPLSQLSSIEKIYHFASFFTEYGKLGAAVLEHLNSPEGDKIAEARQLLEANYYGAFQNEVHFIKSRLEELKDNSVDPSRYQSIADITFFTHLFSLTVEGVLHVFDKN